MSAAERARELLAYYDSCRARETVPAVTADTTDVIRDLLAELDQANADYDEAVDDWGANDEQMLAENARLAAERDAALAAQANSMTGGDDD